MVAQDTRQIVNGLLVRDQHVLMARRSPTRQHYPDSWSFPGGHVEHDETLEDALVRELTEEISVHAVSWAHLSRFDHISTKHDQSVSFHYFRINEWHGQPKNLGDEHTEIRWFLAAEAAAMDDLAFPNYRDILGALEPQTR